MIYYEAIANDNERTQFRSRFVPSELGIKVLREGKILADGESPGEMIERMTSKLFEPEQRYGMSSVEIQRLHKRMQYFLDGKYCVMSTPIMTNAGRYEDKPLSACTVPPVDLRGDLAAVKQIVDKFHQDGMGTGFNLSETEDPVKILRFLNGVAVEGAKSGKEDRPVGNMAILHVSHPKIQEFIDCKVGADSRGEDWKFNISVDASDEFMHAARDRTGFRLADGQEVDARVLLEKIVTNAHICGDPGLIFIDRMNRDNPTPGVGNYVSTAPCAEVGLAPGESCQFGYINLGKFITGDGKVDYQLLSEMTHLMTRALDNALDLSIDHYAHTENKRVMSEKRKIGVGICGLSDMFHLLHIPYDSDEARKIARDVIGHVNYQSKLASHELAIERGSFGAMNDRITCRYNHKQGFIEQKYGQVNTETVTAGMWLELGERVRKTGKLRNASTIALPPTGRSGLVIDASTGIEPAFSLSEYGGRVNDNLRYALEVAGAWSEDLRDYVIAKGSVSEATVPDSFKGVYKTALEISPDGHLQMVGAIQEVIDESVSKTINMPHEASVEDVMGIYLKAHELGLKGITIYRTGCRVYQPRKTN